MLHFPRWKVFLILSGCILAMLLALPNLEKVRQSPIAEWLPAKQVNLGLDLRGGSYLLLEVDFQSYLMEQLQALVDDVRLSLRKERIGYVGLRATNGHVSFQLRSLNDSDKIRPLIRDISRDITVSTTSDTGFILAYNEDSIDKMQRSVIEQSIEIVRRRVDETGTTEPIIQQQGSDRILLQVPGLQNPESLKRLLGQTAKMTFHLVDESVSAANVVNKKAPPGSMYVPHEDTTSQGVIVKRRAMLTGDLLIDAHPDFDENRQPAVAFRFNTKGGRIFADITKNHIGQRFAIILDNKVLTAPVIRTPILSGSGIITGNFTVQSAADLSLLLRAGALPAPLEILEERTVGPSLGSDSIEAGKIAVIIGTILVMLFMLLTYGLFGLFSNIALIINFIILVAALSTLQATLTLPGIAGIVLTLGMAVDANVLIFERIREETNNGRTPFSAVDYGFKQAFKTIIDSNLTTLIAALLLYMFGSGPVKGFAVTLSIGIIASMFSAILLTRLMVVLWLKRKRPAALAV